MKQILTANQMKAVDENTIRKHGITSTVLIERAALAVVEEIEKRAFDQGKIVVVCGSGNNGADGIAIARQLYLKGKNASIMMLNSIPDDNSQLSLQCKTAMSYDVPIEEDMASLDNCDTIVDAIFGIGLSRSIEGIYEAAIARINKSTAKVVSVDIPSGLASTTGNVLGICVCADLTVTFAYEKRGFYFGNSFEYVGELVCKDVGIYSELTDEKMLTYAIEKTDLSLLPQRLDNAHKGMCGKVLIIAGNEEMSGAAYFAGKAAMVSGCGLVKIYTHKSNIQILHGLLPEAIVIGFEDYNKHQIRELCEWADAILIGPGFGTNETSNLIFKEVIKTSTVPTVIDADAITMLANDSSIYDLLHKDCIITPHFGEMSRLIGRSIDEIKADTYKCATTFANEHTLTCLLKDHRTVIASPYSACYINSTGNSGMATAGSGDVLSGIIVSLLSQGMNCPMAAALGAYIHGMAGDVMVKYKGIRGLLASDIIDGIIEVIK